MTTQAQALAGFSLQVRKGNTWPMGAEEDHEGEGGRFWLAKTKDDLERIGGTMTFIGQVFKEGWIAAKAQCHSLLHERGPGTTRDSFVALVVDSKSKSKKNPWVPGATDRALIEAARLKLLHDHEGPRGRGVFCALAPLLHLPHLAGV